MTTSGIQDPTSSAAPATSHLSTEELSQLIDVGLRTLYQPMLDTVHGEVIGYESFVRGPAEHALERPALLFPCAQNQGLMPDLESHSQNLAIQRFVERKFSGKLFLNCEPTAFLDPRYARHTTIQSAEAHGLKPEQVVIELTADYFKSDFAALREALEHYRAQGFQTAIAELGTGHNGLRLWSEIQPEFVKLDQHFTRDINTSTVKQSFISAIAHLCNALHTKLIVTGVETIEEKDCLSELGVQIMQGFFFSRPEEHPAAPPSVQQSPPRRRSEDSHIASDLSNWIEPVCPKTDLETVWLRFEKDPGCHAVPVVTDNKPLGFLHRSQLYELFAKPDGRSLFSHETVGQHVSNGSFIVPQSTRLSELSRQITEEDDGLLRQQYI
ncbi:MAG: EAL domain-containing protein, partial [Natronospirillum sp.]